MNNNNFNITKSSELDIKEEILKYTRHWKWFVLAIISCLVLAFLYLSMYATPLYESNAKLIIKQQSKSEFSQELSSAFADGAIFGSENVAMNEIEILKSRTLNEVVVDSLDLTTEVYKKEILRSVYLFRNKPFSVTHYIPNDNKNKTISFLIVKEGNVFTLIKDNQRIENITFDKDIVLEEGVVRIKNIAKDGIVGDGEYIVSKLSKVKQAQKFSYGLNISLVDRWSDIVTVSLVHQNPVFVVDYINTLIYFYNKQSKIEKQYVAETTSDFISHRLNIIATELGDVEKSVENYKANNNIADVQSEIKSFISDLSDFERNYIENETKIKITKDLINHISSSKTDDLVPGGMLANDISSETAINQINSLIIEKQKLSVSSTIENPNYQSLESQILNLKQNLIQSLRRHLSSLEIARNDLKKQETEIQSKLNRVPTQEREFRIIERQQKVKESLYLFLLQKREENNITLAVVEENARVIDNAIPSDTPVSPRSMIIYAVALISGILIPFVVIYVLLLLDNKIKTREDLALAENNSIPYLGDVPTSYSSESLMSFESRSATAEAIRIIRTNMEFLLANRQGHLAKTIFVTSTLPSEGKSFICANLAATVALSGKKVLLIGLDLRNPRIKDYINIPTSGFTNYLMQTEKTINDYIVNIPGYPDFHVLPSGNIPPNPAELLISDGVKSIFEQLKKQYDYILVDTAPVAPVTDTLLIGQYADMFIYVVRANKLDKKALEIPIRLHKENKLPNMSFVLNDTDMRKGYGYSYDYGSTEEQKKPFWKKIFRKK